MAPVTLSRTPLTLNFYKYEIALLQVNYPYTIHTYHSVTGLGFSLNFDISNWIVLSNKVIG